MRIQINHNGKAIIKIICFTGIFFYILAILNQLLIPKWYYPNNIVNEPTGRVITGFYAEEKNSIDVIVLGTSHMAYGFSPMEVYENFGIKSYNLATSVQPIQSSYYIIKEALKYQNPKVICLDASSLFLSVQDSTKWRFILDQMPLSINKSDYAVTIERKFNNQSYISAILPTYRYHERWKELTKEDFSSFYRNTHFFNKGYYMCPAQTVGTASIDSMNEIMDDMLARDKQWTYEYIQEKYQEETDESPLYTAELMDNNIEWLLKIRDLCTDAQVEFMLVKIPTVHSPLLYESAWTRERSQKVKALSDEFGLQFLDLLYDLDIGINWETDTADGGSHLNLLGSQKVSSCLAQYWMEHYSLKGVKDINWEKDLATYRKMREIALLQMEEELSAYLQKLTADQTDKAIFLATKENIAELLEKEEIQLLTQLGLHLNMIQIDPTECTFGAIIINGKVVYEGYSNRQVIHNGELEESKVEYNIESYGHYVSSAAKISIDGKNYALDGTGIKIVVYDTKRHLILDSVNFDLYGMGHRINEKSIEYLRALENYLIEVEDR